MGAKFTYREGGYLPLAGSGAAKPLPITYELPVASAQVKSAILLAGLNTSGATTVIEPEPTRDHTELMLKNFGAELKVEPHGKGGRAITLTGWPELTGRAVYVPADPSSAAFPVAAALIVPGSEVTITGVGINPLRAGLFTTLLEMGANITYTNQRLEAGEPVADLVIKHGELLGIDVAPERAPSMIDEYPILSVIAAFANGPTRMRGLAELRVKESDRLTAMAKGLAAAGVKLEVEGDDLIVHGNGKPPKGGARIEVNLDHRIAMSFLIMGMASDEPLSVDDAAPVATSFPGFVELMNGLGGKISPPTA
jgi:3-phosphoshikimate 1-carboxyvinyltransferase